MLEIRIHQTIGETLAANTNAFQNAVAGQLIEAQRSVQNAALLQFVGDDATDKVGIQTLVATVQRILELNASLQIQTEIDKFPLNTLPFVLFLLQNEHVVVEKLLQTFVDEIDPLLFERVEVENFETGNVQNADEKAPIRRRNVQRFVATPDEPQEHTGVDGFGQGADGPMDLEGKSSIGEIIP
uniref:Uncharacterized protein n=1 Tax=Romanomermis culicivorax TaxID=13658 RepID=A0A915KMT5_ROMCU